MFQKPKPPEVPIKMGLRAEEEVNCTNCGKTLTVGTRHTFKGKGNKDVYFCDECLVKVNADLEAETKDPNILGALIVGLIGAIIGGALWFGFVLLTQREIGYIGILLGIVIAYAVHFGSGKKRGFNLQIISAVLTALTLVLSEIAIFAYLVGKELITETSLTTYNPFTMSLKLLTTSTEFRDLFISVFFKEVISPIGLLIWAISIYYAFNFLKVKRLKTG